MDSGGPDQAQIDRNSLPEATAEKRLRRNASPHTIAPENARSSRRRSTFFFFTSFAMMVITYLGFGLNLAMDLRKVRPLPPALAIHATCNGLWFALLVIQSVLIQKRKVKIHRTLGFASILLAISILVTGQYAVNYFLTRFHAAGKNPSPFGFYVQWISFGVLYGLGMLRRNHAAYHKRYMLFSALAMMLAGSDRLFEVLGIPGGIVVRQWIPTLFCALVMLQDWLQLKTIHPGTVIGTSIYTAEVFVLAFARPILKLFGGA